MYYGNIKNCDIADGPGVRVSLFVSGCTNHCEGCFQPETWNFCFGEPFTERTEQELLGMLAPSYIAGLTLLGGDPMEPDNQRALLPFLRRVRAELPGKTIWAYSGYTFEALRQEGSRPRCEATDEVLSLLDVLVDGPFVLTQKDVSLRFRGSRNQRILDVPKSLAAGEAVLWED
jgi:anaerobic ribonucleoside-triphosphate reductase activating protein